MYPSLRPAAVLDADTKPSGPKLELVAIPVTDVDCVKAFYVDDARGP